MNVRGARWAHFLLLAGLALLLAALAACRDATPAAGPAPSGDMIYAETFTPGETGPWQVEGDANGQTAVVDGRMVFDINAPNTVQYSTLEGEVFRDFYLEVEGTLAAGSPDSTYGILFRMAGPGQFYRYSVTGAGQFVVERHDGEGAWSWLTEEWQDSEALIQGVGSTNKLALRAVSGTFSFYANDELLLQVSDGRYGQGQLALSAGTFGQPGLQVLFDNLLVSEP